MLVDNHKGGLKSFSAFGRLLELNNRTSQSPPLQSQRPPSSSNKIPRRAVRKQSNTTAFTSISREKKGNFRFPIRLCKHEFKYHPDYFYGKERLPSWSMSKAERTPRGRYVDYEICTKSPLFARTKRTNSTNNSWVNNSEDRNQESKVDKMASTKADSKGFATARTSHSVNPNKTCTDRFNYSIIQQKELSPVGQFQKSKVATSMKLGKQELMNIEIQERDANQSKKLLGDVYIDMSKKKGRDSNINHQEYQGESHFNNFTYSMNLKNKIHDFNSYLARQDVQPSKAPIYDLLAINLDKIRQDLNKGNVKLHTFRDRIRVRYDRAEPPAHTRLCYDYDLTKLGHLQEGKATKFEKYKDREEELFPIVDPAIKRDSDKIITQELKKELIRTSTDPMLI